MSTTNKGVIYPTSGDSIAPLETHFAALATSADNAGIVSGAFAFTGPSATGSTVDVTVTYATLGAVPKVTATVQGGASASVYAVTILGAPTATQFIARVYRLNGSTAETNLKLVWHASTYA